MKNIKHLVTIEELQITLEKILIKFGGDKVAFSFTDSEKCMRFNITLEKEVARSEIENDC